MSSTPLRLSRPARIQTEPRRTLDFDLETVAAGYADPNWVPNIVTAWSCSWTDSEQVVFDVLPVARLFDKPYKARFLRVLVELIAEAQVVTGHNIIRFDLPVLNAELMRLGMANLEPVLAQDTIRLPRTKGFKKGQDNIATLLKIPLRKKTMNWQEWHDAYSEPDLKSVKERVVSDVEQHKLVRLKYRERGWLEAPRLWKP